MKGVANNEFCNLKFVAGVKFSPKGKNLCFTVSNALLEENKYESFIYKLERGKPVQLTSGGKEGGFLYLDEDTILFAGDRDESKNPSIESKYYSISLKGGEAKKAFTFPIPVNVIKKLKDGNLLVTGTIFPGYEDLYKGDKKLAKKYLDEQKENEDYEVITQNPWWWNGSTYIRGAYDILFMYDVKKNKLTPLTEFGASVADVKVSGDEKYAYFFVEKNKTVLDFHMDSFERMELATGKREVIREFKDNLFSYNYALCDSFGILLLSDEKQMGENSDPDFYRFDYDTLKITKYAEFKRCIGSTVGSDIRRGGGESIKAVGDTLYFISTDYDDAMLYKLEDGVISKVIDKNGSIDCFDISGEKIVLSALWDMKATELYDGNQKQITHFNDKAFKGKYVAIPERCDVNRGDYDVHGFVLKPIDYDPDKKYPVVFDIHGGPKVVFGPVYYHEMQYWAGKGYFVIFCNPTGADGRGNEFGNICGKYGTVDFDDLMAFADKCLETYPAMDKEHLYETGGSYGGFMTNWIVGHTDRFKACVTQRSISNWFSFYGISDIGITFTKDQQLATPWENPQKLWEQSPMKYINNCKTPTLVLHSEQDYRCPIDQGYQMYTSLVANGVDSKMVIFKGENHDLSRTGKPKHRVRRLNEITEWFENHK